MSQCQTKYFGEVEYGRGAVVKFRAGLPGFEDEKRFILIDRPDLKPLIFVQSLKTAELCFPTLSVLSLAADYQLEMEEEDRKALGFSANPVIGKDVACLAVVNIRETEAVANLLAPLVIELKTRRAVQAVTGGGYSHAQPIGGAYPVVNAAA